jgi:hypothetical protein
MTRDTILRGVTLLPVAVLLLSSCGGSTSTNVASSGAGTTTPQLVPPCGIEGTGAASFNGPISGIDTAGHVTINSISFSADNAKVVVDGSAGSLAQLQVQQVVTVFGTLDTTTNTGCANTILSDANIAGAISTLDLSRRSFTVIGQQVFVNAGTVFGSEIAPAALATLHAGDVVRVSGLVGVDGAITATRIDLWPDLVGYEATGGVANLDAAGATFHINQTSVLYRNATLIGFPAGQIHNGDAVLVTGAATSSVSGSVAINATRVEALGSNATPGSTAVNISAQSAVVRVGGSIQFTVSSQTAVTWGVSSPNFYPLGTPCTPALCGTIDSTGRYVAPRSVPYGYLGLLITATSSTMTATGVVFVVPVPSGIGVSPTSATVQDNAVAHFNAFSATESPFGVAPVVGWNVSGPGCSGASCGTISPDGQYTAPAVPPNPPIVKVTATSATDASKSGSATVMLGGNPNNAKLKGSYAFLLSGYDGDGLTMVAGSFTADGNGNITAAIEDVNFPLAFQTTDAITTIGSYSVDPDNRGSVTLPFPTPFYFVRTFSFALGNFAGTTATRGRITYYQDDFANTGVLIKQDPAAFSTAAIKGDYAFGFSGGGSTGVLAAAGRFTASDGSVGTGLIDVNDPGRPAPTAPFTGAYAVDSNGRGLASITITGQPSGQPRLSQFVFYVASAGELLFMQTEGSLSSIGIGSPISGTALQQSGGPFSLGSLNGPTVLDLTGFPDIAVAQQSFDGNGKFSGSIDENNQGVITSNAQLTGSYAVDADGLGHGAMSVIGDQKSYAFYLVSPGRAFIIDSAARAGVIEPQVGGPFGDPSVAGDYVLGALPAPMNWWVNFLSGVLTADGVGGLVGAFDGAVTGESFTGSYAVAPNGRSTLTITPSVEAPTKMVFYLVSPSRAVGIPADAGANMLFGANPTLGVIEK